jgi:group I intron endonuclease
MSEVKRIREYCAVTDKYAYGIIYLAKNFITGKVYVGQTIYSLKDRIRRHFVAAKDRNKNQYFTNALRKYGKQSFCFGIIEYIFEEDQNFINNREIYWINYYKSNIKEYGYNSTSGGNSFQLSPDSILKLKSSLKRTAKSRSSKAKKRWKDQEFVSKMRSIRCDIWKRPSYRDVQTKRSIGEKNGNSKSWIFTDPNGNNILIKGNFQKFCRENNLSIMAMRILTTGILPSGRKSLKDSYKGWKVCKA